MDYQVDLDSFRGPMDLLLFLVKRNEVDIRDIPIARITEQFLEYMHILEMVDVERAGDFLVMASTLMEIKSRMLLPHADDGAEDEDDPRLELVRQLMEYKKFKDAAALLEVQAEKQLARMPRHPLESAKDYTRQELSPVELWDLVSAFGRLMRETLALAPRQIVMDETPQYVVMERILQRLETESRLSLSALFDPPHYRGRLVGIFLAILELIKAKSIEAFQDQAFGDIWIAKAVAPAAPLPEVAENSPQPNPPPPEERAI